MTLLSTGSKKRNRKVTNSYGIFADYYDRFTKNVSYVSYAKRLDEIIMQRHKKRGSIVDLGCGTGTLDLLLAKKGYSVTGVDRSCEMLTVADKKLRDAGEKALFIRQDMTSFSLPQRADAIISTLDGINHLKSAEAVTKTFKCVSKNLRHGGIFVFDINTIYKHRHTLGNNCFIFDTDEVYFGWQNDYRESDNSVLITLDFFVNGNRSTETFREKAYPVMKIFGMLLKSGLIPLEIYDGISHKPPKKTSDRVLIVAGKL
ncbi:MAG: class I SAM-dependent methyltransferase [Oscillospiraceae bacterium]|nr:class I SAM-dependent methyltransferase [Oscillospiraceae bacterium]